MTVSSRLALAMVVLVVVTSGVVSAFAWYFVAKAPPHGASTAIISAALAGGAIASVFGIALAVAITNGLRKPAEVRREPEEERAYQTLIDNEKMARAIIEEALDAFVQTDGNCVVLNWSPHAEALMGWTREEAIGRSVEKLLFPESLWVGHRQWIDQFLSQAKGEAAGGRYRSRPSPNARTVGEVISRHGHGGSTGTTVTGSCQLTKHSLLHHVGRNQVHAVRDEVATGLVAGQAPHVRDNLLAEPVQINLVRARRSEQDDSTPPQGQRHASPVCPRSRRRRNDRAGPRSDARCSRNLHPTPAPAMTF